MIFRWRFPFIAGLGFIVLDSCQTDNKSKTSICPSYAVASCAIPQQSFKLKFIDANTKVDLLFAKDSKYHLDDLKIYSTRLIKNVDFTIDSSEQNQKYILFSTNGTDEFKISLADKSIDQLVAETNYNDEGCCGQLNLTKLSLNGQSIAFTNYNPTVILLKK